MVKRLEANKIRRAFKEEEKTILLPISFGISSISLLNILDQHLCNRAQHGRHPSYRLHVLFVDQSQVLDQDSPQASMNLLKQRFPSHTYSVISLESLSKTLDNFEYLSGGEHEQIEDIVSNLRSKTSKLDFIDTMRRRLILSFAKNNECESILFGDSTTRLAEKTLSETAKGRGTSLPWLTADGSSFGIYCVYPMRDLLRKEIASYVDLVSPALSDIILKNAKPPPTSSKDTTIDNLMSQYFESVEENYPSIMSNVVRTSAKLVAPHSSNHDNPCTLCGFPAAGVAWDGDQESTIRDHSQPSNRMHDRCSLCYGCIRTMSQS